MTEEKEPYGAVPPYNEEGIHRRESKVDPIVEAAELYGDVATAEEYGYVTRG